MSEHTTRMTSEMGQRLRQTMEQRLRQQQSERDLLAQDLRQKYLRPSVPDAVAEKVFNKAWEDGHASGTHEVEIHYDDLSEIVNAAFKAGQENPK